MTSELKELMELLGREIGRRVPRADCEKLGSALIKALREAIPSSLEDTEIEEIVEAFKRECRIEQAGK